MGTGATIAVVTFSALSFLTSATTLAVVIYGGKRAENEIEDVKERANSAIRGMKHALNNLEF